MALGAAVSLTFSACGGDSDGAGDPEPCVTPSAAATASVSRIPEDIPLVDFGTVTKVETSRGFVGAEAVTKTSIVELYPPLARSVLDAGYDILSGDNEGFEAEIFFARGKETTATYLLREGPCKDLVTIKLVYSSRGRSG